MSALKGFRVIELAEGVAGEYCGKLLSDFGAEVIKIERTKSGSPTRAMAPKVGEGVEQSGLFAYLNTNKKSIALDLLTNKDVLHKLIAAADVVIDDHDEDWLAALGISQSDAERAFPKVVFCSITPFGHGAPKEWRNARSLQLMNASGWAYHTPTGAPADKPPLKGPGRFLADYEGAIDAALCIVSTLYWREHSEQGQHIDVSALESLISRADLVLGRMLAGEAEANNTRGAYDMTGPASFFKCVDGAIYLFMTTPTHWAGLCNLMGEPDWIMAFPKDWLEFGVTPERVAEFRAGFATWALTQHKVETSEKAQKLGVPITVVNDASDLPRSPQYQHRGYFQSVRHPALGEALYPTAPYKLSATPARITSAAPLLGEHNDALEKL